MLEQRSEQHLSTIAIRRDHGPNHVAAAEPSQYGEAPHIITTADRRAILTRFWSAPLGVDGSGGAD